MAGNARDTIKLKDGDRIAVIGGGPAGCFFAYMAMERAKADGLDVEILLFDGKDFRVPGPKGCNMCAGTIGDRLVKGLDDLGFEVGSTVKHRDIDGYVFHADGGSEILNKAPGVDIYTVFRSRGPRDQSPFDSDRIGFDQHLLEFTESKGVQFYPEHVVRLDRPKSPQDPWTVVYGKHESSVQAHLVVGTFGVNSSIARTLTFGYKRPRTWHACNAEVWLGPEAISEKLGNYVHIIPVRHPAIRFIAVTPKHEFVTLTGIGPHVRQADLVTAVENSEIADLLPKPLFLSCHCHPQLPVSPPRRPYTDRFIIIGDAGYSRYLKNGIESALISARTAVRAVFGHGVSKVTLRRHYDRPVKKIFRTDNKFGVALFRTYFIIHSRKFLARWSLAMVSEERHRDRGRRLGSILWDLFAGETPYRSIFLRAFNPALLVRAAGAFWHRKRWPTSKESTTQQETGSIRVGREHPEGNDRIGNHSRIVIIGGGPAGSSCAIKLKLEARRRGFDPEVILFDGKRFDTHYNQCIGVLSPPFERHLDEKLELSLPESLVRYRIRNYRLHGDHRSINLSNPEEPPTWSVRRRKLDDFLLNQASALGVKVINSRITYLEFVREGKLDEARVYSESNTIRADFVVAAFGLDDAMLNVLEEATAADGGYRRPPRYLKSFIGRLDASEEFVSERLGDTIYAFLPSSLPRVEFGAVTPKASHLTINIAGEKVSSLDLERFLQLDEVARRLPEFDMDKLNFFEGKFPVAPAKGAAGHGYLVTGDATGWMRPFKGKGINIAIITGVRAAEALLENGRKEASEQYIKKCKDLHKDYHYGVYFRKLTNIIAKMNMIDDVIATAVGEPKLGRALYNAVSGGSSFKRVLADVIDPRLITSMGLNIIKGLGKDLPE
ncbi:NAD(P)/FAD-dependent oxidoreductase [candidate division KSB1 bacterium]